MKVVQSWIFCFIFKINLSWTKWHMLLILYLMSLYIFSFSDIYVKWYVNSL